MLALISAGGNTKEEVITNLKEALADFEKQSIVDPIHGCLADNWEYDLFKDTPFLCMADYLTFENIK